MCLTAPDSIAIDENIDLVTAKQITDRYNIAIEGNIPLASCMLLGTQQDNMKFVVDLLDAVGHQNLIISPGCDMPYDVPPENAIGVAETIRNVEQARQILALYTAEEMDLGQVMLPDYENLAKPLIEVFTIDSASCPACGYMKLAGERAYADMAGGIDMIEYKATLPENIARMKKLGIKNLPAMFINGELRFSSLIPSHQELMEVIEGYL
jgi:uroporphyrinogen decarboxylase